MGIRVESNGCKTLVFSYGTLKRGFSNHVLIQDLIRSGDAVFKGTYTTVENYPLVCGPYRVPFLLNIPGSGRRVTGELYAVTPDGLARLDELEGTSRGHYVRLPIRLMKENSEKKVDDEENNEEDEEGGVICAEAYYAHGSYDKELWRKSGKIGFGSYTEKEAKGYVKRKDRPQDVSFLDHISIFISSNSD